MGLAYSYGAWAGAHGNRARRQGSLAPQELQHPRLGLRDGKSRQRLGRQHTYGLPSKLGSRSHCWCEGHSALQGPCFIQHGACAWGCCMKETYTHTCACGLLDSPGSCSATGWSALGTKACIQGWCQLSFHGLPLSLWLDSLGCDGHLPQGGAA